MTDTTNAQQPAAEVHNLDPRTLLVDANIRTEIKLGKDFIDSIRDLGVLLPIIAVRTANGRVRVRLGNRRTLAAIEAGQPAVPVIVAGDESTGTTAEIERIIGQYHENTQRAALSDLDEVSVVAALFDLGVPAAHIAKRTKMPKPKVAAAKKVAGSELATAATARYDFLTLDQAATIADFEDDPEALKALVTAAQHGPGSFEHVSSRLRETAAERAVLAQARTRLEESGLAIVDRLDWASHLSSLRDADGNDLTEETHRNCPGHAAFLDLEWVRPATADQDDVDAYQPVAVPVYVCTAPEANEHISKYPAPAGRPQAAADPEAAKAERRTVIQNNKQWRAAETVRRAWLTALLARKNPPQGALGYVLAELAASHWRLTAKIGAHELACELIGFDGKDALAAAMNQAAGNRAQVIALGLILGAFEDFMTTDTWRNPTPQDRDYLTRLTEWGYEPSDIERTVLGQEADS